MTEPGDDELMARSAGGDGEAFRLLVLRWERPLYAFLHRMTGSREDAQDLGQETFLRLHRQAERYRAEGRFKSWLFRIAGNLARSRARRRKILTWVGLDGAAQDVPIEHEAVDERLEREDRKRVVREALAGLPDRQREAVILRRWEEMSPPEIAETMGISVSAVDALLHRAAGTLRRTLSRKEEIR